MIRALVLLLSVVVGCFAADLDADRLAVVLAQREGYRGVDGGLGELGPWQIREITWGQHMPGVQFSEARKPGPARACALKHIAWLIEQLERIGVPATSFNVAAAWNAGFKQYTTGRAPVRAYRFAADVEALYHDALRAKIVDRELPTIGNVHVGDGLVQHGHIVVPKFSLKLGAVGVRQGSDRDLESILFHVRNLRAPAGESSR